MRKQIAVLLMAALPHAALAQTAPLYGASDPTTNLRIEPLPEVVVDIPSDPTEFAPLNARALPPTPALPEVGIAEPPVASQQAPAPAPAAPVAVVPPPSPPQEAAIVADALTLPEPLDPNAAIALIPDRTAPAPRIEPLPPLPVSPPATASAPQPAQPLPPASLADVRGTIDQALVTVSAQAQLPQSVWMSIRGYYMKRDGKPLFTADGELQPMARTVAAVAARAGEHGLDAARYQRVTALMASPDATVREMAAATTAVLYARDARGGRISPRQVSALITATPALPEGEAVLDSLAASADAAATLEGYNPRHPGYLALKAKLADMARPAAPAPEAERLAFGPILVAGMSDARVPVLRALLNLPPQPDQIYDSALAEAVKEVQRQHGLRPTGRLDRRAVVALGGGPAPAPASNAAADIIANMEAWRWLPRTLGTTHIMVNVPSFHLTMRQNGAPVFETRVVVGKPQTPTPIFSHKMEFLVVNPFWNVPPSIALKEYLPLLQRNPYALQGRGLEVVYRGRTVDPATIDWTKASRNIGIRQPPGERNALGHIKFMFPNEHAVYLHDTPSRGLFANGYRAYSHGCVRVQNPFRLAEAVLGGGWSETRLRGMVGGPERNIPLSSDVHVHLAYFTMEVGASGELVRHADIYGHTRRLKTLLGL